MATPISGRPVLKADRPRIPASYGISKSSTEYVDWLHVEERLTTERVYWVATSGPGGRARVRPVDGLYLDGVIYVGGSPEARWVRDIAANPHVSVHLDGVDDVVIVEGEAEILPGASKDLAERLAAASRAKFPEYGITADSYTGPGTIAIRPRKVVAWTDFGQNPSRFRFA
jgi:nitroimidazol reductase NimA-like FMN-containing flavoprotein (pyridoxamine 5'-phosphate oxidase superfamily)